MYTPEQFNVIVSKLPNGVTVTQSGDGSLSFQGATPEQLVAIQAVIDNFATHWAAYLAKKDEENISPFTAREWFAAHPAAVAFVRLTPAEQKTQIDGMALAQLKTLLEFVIIAVAALIKERYIKD